MIDDVSDRTAGTGLAQRIADVMALDANAPAIEFEGSWSTWGQLADTARQAAAVVDRPGGEVGIILRNRPASVGFLLGVLSAGGCVVTINPGRGRDRTRDDIATLDLAVLAGEEDDLAELTPVGSRAITAAASVLGEPVVVSAATDRLTAPLNADRPETAVRMLTSGTTGPPKRVDLSYRMLERVLTGAKHYESNRDETVRLRRGVAIVNSPLVHLGGLFRVLQCVSDGRSLCLLERFTVDAWSDAVRRHRPATASLVPAAMRMVLDADLDPGDLSSVRSVVSGTAPLDPDDADAFTARFGIPVLVTYAATEFGGSVAGWNLDDHERFWTAKRGSVGRAHAGCELRIVNAESGQPVAPDAEGLLEVKARQLGNDAWVRTTDMARLDEEGFLFILGRADQAIIRGGFKVRPDDIKAALERHPAVRGAAVVGRDDRRLGAVPVAVVELRPGAGPGSTDELLSYLAGILARYELPTEIHPIETLPRTDSGKVDLFAINAFLDAGIGSTVTGREVDRWTFGVDPLPQTVRAASLLRRVTSLTLALENDDDEVERLIRDLERSEAVLRQRVPADPAPRVGAAASGDGRVYLDHAFDIGAYNPCVPEYGIEVEGDLAQGSVAFPIAYEGPPGLVHGGFLAVFFDSVVQHHNCELGQAGKTTSLLLTYRRPTPLLTELAFVLHRSVADERIHTLCALSTGDTVLCRAEVSAIAGVRANLPEVSLRRAVTP